MAISKIIYGGDVLLDLTADTVTAEHLIKGYTAHGADGETILGAMKAAAGGGITVLSGTVTPASSQRVQLNVALPDANFTLLVLAPDSSMSPGASATLISHMIYMTNNAGKDVYLQTWKRAEDNTSSVSGLYKINIDRANGTISFLFSGMPAQSFVSGSTYRWYYAYG